MNTEPMRICRDEDCPQCGHPETYAVIDLTRPDPGADSFGCSNCGWSTPAEALH